MHCNNRKRAIVGFQQIYNLYCLTNIINAKVTFSVCYVCSPKALNRFLMKFDTKWIEIGKGDRLPLIAKIDLLH